MDKKIKLIISAIIIMAIIAVGYSIYKKSSEPVSEEAIKIGAILPLTGKYAGPGEFAKNGLFLALDEIRLVAK